MADVVQRAELVEVAHVRRNARETAVLGLVRVVRDENIENIDLDLVRLSHLGEEAMRRRDEDRHRLGRQLLDPSLVRIQLNANNNNKTVALFHL